MSDEDVKELLLHRFETEKVAAAIYKAAIPFASDPHQRRSWQHELEQIETHARVVRRLCKQLHIDLNESTLELLEIRGLGQSLVRALDASRTGGRQAAQHFAEECVALVDGLDAPEPHAARNGGSHAA